MKRIFSAILATMMIGSAAIATVSAAEKVEGRKTVEAYIATDIKVDGEIEDSWKYAPVINIDQRKSNTDKTWYKDTMEAGVDYAKATAKVLWDGDKTLFILCEVVDKTPNYTATSTWKTDSFDLFFCWNNTTVAGSEEDGHYRIMGNGFAQEPMRNPTALVNTADGWLMEYSIDVSKVGGAGQYFGVDFQYNDNVLGNGNRECNLGWSDTDDKASSDASVYGQCLLSDKSVADVKAAQTTAPATFDAGIILAFVAVAAGAGVVVSGKRK